MDKLEVNPWFSVWCRPRRTIRAIIETNSNHGFHWLAFLYGFMMMLNISRSLFLGTAYSMPAIFLFSLVLAWPIGYVSFNISSALFFWTGKWLRRRGSYSQVRAAIAWSNVPVIVNLITWLILMGAYGPGLFADGFGKDGGVSLFQIMLCVQFIVNVWGFVIFLHAYGEVQGCSAWMSLLNVVIVAVLWILILMVIGWGVYSINSTASIIM